MLMSCYMSIIFCYVSSIYAMWGRGKGERQDWEDKKELTSMLSATGQVCVLLEIVDSELLPVKFIQFN